jgi:hypothetical protein
MQKIGKILDGPVKEKDCHPAMLSNTLGNAGYIGPQTVTRLSWGIADYSHYVIN